MARPLSVLLIEDEPAECQEIIRCIELTGDIQLTNVTNNAVKALEYIANSPPDAIILDLELHKGYGNGLIFLGSLQKMRLSAPIYVLVTTNNISLVTHEMARKLGADFIMVKCQEGYSAKTVVDFLAALKDIIQSNKQIASDAVHTETVEEKQRRLVSSIAVEFDRIGIPPNAIGRQYLMDSIVLIVNGHRDKLYEAISQAHAKTAASVERAMHNAIEKAWNTANIDDLEKYYTALIHSSKGVPTIMEFVHHYAEKIRNAH